MSDGEIFEVEETMTKKLNFQSEIEEMPELEETKKLTLVSADGETFEVDETIATYSETIRQSVQDSTGDIIPIPMVTGKVLAKVIEYCNKHAGLVGVPMTRKEKEEIKKWDIEFVDVDQPDLFDLIMAANFLNIKDLLELSCQKIADALHGKTVEEMRKICNVKNDFTPEEEKEMEKNHQWLHSVVDLKTQKLEEPQTPYRAYMTQQERDELLIGTDLLFQ